MPKSPIHFSPSAANGMGAFIHAGIAALPTDALPVTALKHRQLLEKQAAGYRIRPGTDGRPVAIAPAKPSLDQLRARAIAAVKAEAGARILAIASLERQANDNAAIAIAALAGAGDVSAELERRRRIDAIRAASNTIEATIARMPASNLANFDASADRLWPAQD